MGSNEETNAAGTDTRPPMLVESDYDSWKIRIHRYIRGKPNGKLIWKSIQNGPTPHPMITDPPTTDSAVVPAPRKKLDSEFSEEENKLEMADTQAEIILSQGRTIQQRKEDLFDKYERFRAIGNESIHDYFVRFHKLVNDMKITQLNIPTHQMNTKFVNNLPAYWGKYVTNVKQNMDISTTLCQILNSLKATSPHAKKTSQESRSIFYKVLLIHWPMILTPHLHLIANLLSGFQKQFPPTNNQLRTSSNSRTHANVHDGHIVTEPVQRKALGNNGNTVECTAPYDSTSALTYNQNSFKSIMRMHMNSDGMKCLCCCRLWPTCPSTSATTIQSMEKDFLEIRRIATLPRNAIKLGVKPTSGASKPVPKRALPNHSSLPAKSANARRVEAHHRTLNKKNRVDSNLLVKHSVSVSNLNNVCDACNKSLVFANHNDCLVMCDDSVKVKPNQTKRFKRKPKKEWKPIKNVGKPIKRVWKPISKPVANNKPQWKPTGRHFSLFEKYPLTRIVEPTDMPIELPPSASSSPQITMVSRFTDHKLSDRKAGSKGISGILEY
ncbi:hypothetical protein Tco_1238071 [Tanacetum coccineum]